MTTTVPPATTAEEADVQRRVDDLLAANQPGRTDRQAFLEAQFDAGLAWIALPEGCGGLGLAPKLQRIVDTALAKAGAPAPDVARNIIGHGMAAPTIVAHGTPEQRARYLKPLFTGQEIWCQLFSEPGAGSDLAGLHTNAVLHDDVFVVNGQKVWTSGAHHADWCLCFVRTNPDAPKHKGISALIIDMKTP